MTRKTEPFRRSKRPLDGVLLFDKPLELSSNTALLKVRGLYRAEKAGHTGTLDPLATGLLPICLGEATKFTHALLDADKRYRATIRLGQRTTTGDAEGELIEEHPVEVDEAGIREVLLRFTGEIAQLPPMHSALKHQGKPLYEYIRKGEVIDRAPRQVTILELHLERWSDTEMDIDVLCSKGTYVRTLAEDIGEALGCGGHLIALRRTGIGSFGLDDAHTLPELEALDELGRDALLLPVDSLLQEYPVLAVDPVQAGRLAQGQRLGLRDAHPDGMRRLYAEGEFIGLGELITGRLSPSRLLSGIARAVSVPKSA